MQRRAFLVTLGAVGVAGCLGSSGPSTPADSPGRTDDDPSTAEATPTPIDADEVLSVEQRGIVTHATDGGDAERQFAEVRVENAWDRSIGKVTVTADWLNSAGSVEATASQWIYAFEPGAVWRAFVPAESGSSHDGVDVSVEAKSRTVEPGPLSATNDEMTVRDGVAVVTGTVANDGEEDVFPTVFGKFFDDAGTIVGVATASVNDVPADESVQFELSVAFERVGLSAPTDYELVLDTPDGDGADCLCRMGPQGAWVGDR